MSGRLVAALPRATPQEATTLGGDNNTRSTERVTRGAACAEPTHHYTPIHNNILLIAQDACPHARYPPFFASPHRIKPQHPNPRHARVHISSAAQCHPPWLAPRPLRSHYLVGNC